MSAERREAVAWRWARRVLIAIGALAVLGGIALVAVMVGVEWRHRPEPAREIQAAPDAERFVLGTVATLTGTPFIRIAIATRSRDGGYSSYGPSSDDRNIVLLDARTGASRRLLPDNRRRIVAAHFLPAATTDAEAVTTDRAEPPAAVRFCLIEVERPGGGHDLVAGRIEGGRATVVLPGIDEVASVWMRDPGHAAVLAFERGRLAFRVVDMATLTASAPVAVEVGR